MATNVYKRSTVIALATTLLAGVGGWFMLVSPLLDARAETAEQASAVEASVADMNARLPLLMAQLEDITPQVEVLRDLSAKVPPAIDQPSLYADVSQIAAEAGIESIDNISVSVPQVVTSQTGEATEGGEQGGPAVLASYTLTIQARGSYGDIADFVESLRGGQRMAEVTYTSISGEGGDASATIRANLFLQKVDAEGLANQIEALTGQA